MAEMNKNEVQKGREKKNKTQFKGVKVETDLFFTTLQRLKK